MASRYAGGCDGRTVRWRDHQARRRATIVSATVVVIDECGPGLSTERIAAAAGLHRTVESFDSAGGQATILVFGQQSVTNGSHPGPTLSPTQLRAVMQHIGGRWLLIQLTQLG